MFLMGNLAARVSSTERIGVGGALTIGGAIMLIVRATRSNDGDEEDDSEEDTEVSLMHLFLGQNSLGLSVSGRF
jgi:hypothetical protein